jgi:hypothetical protein
VNEDQVSWEDVGQVYSRNGVNHTGVGNRVIRPLPWALAARGDGFLRGNLFSRFCIKPRLADWAGHVHRTSLSGKDVVP